MRENIPHPAAAVKTCASELPVGLTERKCDNGRAVAGEEIEKLSRTQGENSYVVRAVRSGVCAGSNDTAERIDGYACELGSLRMRHCAEAAVAGEVICANSAIR